MPFPRLLPASLTIWLSIACFGAPAKIACVGDSITEGAGLGNPSTESYPARLQRLLGTNLVVRNYGVSGRTLLKQGDYPYWKESAYKASHDWNPDVVIIMLGSNDAKPYNWKYGTNFTPNLEELVTTYASLPSLPRVVLCTPCPAYRTGGFDIRPGTVATNIAPAVRETAARLGLPLIDMHTRMAGHLEWFPDNIHPNSKGMAAMAAVVHGTLFSTPEPQSAPELSAQRVTSTRLVLEWPSDWGSLIVQSATSIGQSNIVWSVAETPTHLSATGFRQTNTISGSTRLYRLTRP
jgi:lysophospholipase L1-like esterase